MVRLKLYPKNIEQLVFLTKINGLGRMNWTLVTKETVMDKPSD
jgi:hypothetical protein